MKYILIIIDGASDDPIVELGGQTPLEAAHTPRMDHLARHGTMGRMQTAYAGFPVESLLCIMCILGYDPCLYYPAGRSSFEALARGIVLADADMAFRCNIISVSDDGKIITDFTAGMIQDEHARLLLAQIQAPHPAWELYAGQSYRNLLIVRGAQLCAKLMECAAPHMHIGEPVCELLPQGTTAPGQQLAEELRKFLLHSFESLHTATRPLECAGNMLWLWSPANTPHFPPFGAVHGKAGAVVGGLDFMHGLALAAGMHFEGPPGATGYIDTDYFAKAQAAMCLIEHEDFVVIHINATDEAAHMHDHRAKIQAIESVDALIVGKILDFMESHYKNQFRLSVCVDHKTRCSDGKHVGEPTPYVIFPSPVHHAEARFTEKHVASMRIHPSLSFLGELFHE